MTDRLDLLLARVRAIVAAPSGRAPIVAAGDPVLRAGVGPWPAELDGEAALVADLIRVMTATMIAAPGVGLAAPQIGLPLPLVVIRDPGSTDPEVTRVRERPPLAARALIEPDYAPVGEAARSFYEGCLSVPGYTAVRTRHHAVLLTARTPGGEPVRAELTGWPARIVQHEVDHLRGELYLDRAEPRSLTAIDGPWAARWTRAAAPTDAAATLGFAVR